MGNPKKLTVAPKAPRLFKALQSAGGKGDEPMQWEGGLKEDGGEVIKELPQMLYDNDLKSTQVHKKIINKTFEGLPLSTALAERMLFGGDLANNAAEAGARHLDVPISKEESNLLKKLIYAPISLESETLTPDEKKYIQVLGQRMATLQRVMGDRTVAAITYAELMQNFEREVMADKKLTEEQRKERLEKIKYYQNSIFSGNGNIKYSPHDKVARETGGAINPDTGRMVLGVGDVVNAKDFSKGYAGTFSPVGQKGFLQWHGHPGEYDIWGSPPSEDDYTVGARTRPAEYQFLIQNSYDPFTESNDRSGMSRYVLKKDEDSKEELSKRGSKQLTTKWTDGHLGFLSEKTFNPLKIGDYSAEELLKLLNQGFSRGSIKKFISTDN